MFDYRYHALSLAAVLLALAVGVVLGVAIGDSNLVSSAKSGIVHDLRAEVSGANQQAGQLRSQLTTEEAFATDLYPIAVHELLPARRIGLVFLGGSSDQVDALVREGVAQAGGDLRTVVAIREPLDLAGLAQEAAGTQYTALAETPGLVRAFGVRMGVQLVSGGQLFTRVQGRLLSAFDGQLGRLDGLVVMRGEPTGMSPEAARAASEFEEGLVAGAGAAGATTVGVELSSTEPSQISWYKARDIASVDDLDLLAGRAALAFALAGARGAYGIKPSADAVLPHVPSGP